MRKIGTLFVDLLREYRRDRCGQAASSLAFGTLLSIVPLAALLAWLLRPFHRELAPLLDSLSRYFLPTPELQEIVQRNVQHYTDQALAMGLFGLGFFLLVAWGMLMNVESVFNDIWHVSERRGKVHKLGTFWATVILAPLLFVAGAALNQFLAELVAGHSFAGWFLGDLLPFALMLISLALGYWILPHTKVSKLASLSAALLATLLYQGVKWLFVRYLASFATFDRIYGILSVIPAFLVWLFLVWSVILLGAELSCSVDRMRGKSGSEEKSLDQGH
ncbi:MAG: YhjD/YihY/BrkB family envelope integrity protein [Candidatus Krumholzibacteria bacterium]|jgi:membrane protein|nr:YhjD/YihY/BrkB family envelope integrity protein [Candidatus Krumholzibacteria bacterium]